MTQYITADAVDATVRTIASTFKRSQLVFPDIRRDILRGSDTGRAVRRMVASASQVGSPWITGFGTAELGKYLGGRGYELLEDVGLEVYRQRYLTRLEGSWISFQASVLHWQSWCRVSVLLLSCLFDTVSYGQSVSFPGLRMVWQRSPILAFTSPAGRGGGQEWHPVAPKCSC